MKPSAYPALSLLFILFSSVWISCKKEAAPEKSVAMQAPFVTVEAKDVPIYTEYAAQTSGDIDLDLVSRVDGTLTGIHFKDGQFVKKGQLLYTIDPLPYETQVEQVRGQVAMAQSRLANAQEELNRIKPLAEMNAVSKRELDAATANFQAAKANYSSASASLKNQQLEKSYCQITALMDGIIGISKVEVGDYISRMSATSKLNTLSKLDVVGAKFTVSETQYLQHVKALKAGDKNAFDQIEMVLSDGTVHPYKGKLDYADNRIDPTTGTMTVKASFPNPDKTLRSGQFCKVRFASHTEKNALVVPQKAVTEMQGIFQVNTLNEKNVLEVKIVEVGSKVDENWVITKGLHSGDRVAIIGNQFMQPGMPVVPVPYVAEPLKKLTQAN
ncbi:MAG: efflux RND transporter periplasmic adaptor subunit [Flavobacterium sp.]|nr:efflux RND transporter periplasmic adaptor subunit [Flavobacterium sp.]